MAHRYSSMLSKQVRKFTNYSISFGNCLYVQLGRTINVHFIQIERTQFFKVRQNISLKLHLLIKNVFNFSGNTLVQIFVNIPSSVARLVDLLDFWQLFKAFGSNEFAQISHILRQFL